MCHEIHNSELWLQILKLIQIHNRQQICTDYKISFEFRNIDDVYQFCETDTDDVVNQWMKQLII